MHILYNILISSATIFLKVIALFSKKIKIFVAGRTKTFGILKEKLNSTDKSIWFHCASLGEYEQGVPIIQTLKSLHPKHKIIISFFSPSGYEIKKNTPLADAVVYLPMDTPQNAKNFIKTINPSLAIFIKYEFWPNYLLELKKYNITTLLVSGLFRKDQIFFKPYGGFMRKALKSFNHFFVQDENSEVLLKELGFENVSISGDTRFDRVAGQIDMDNALRFAEDFIGNSLCIVCGSTWPEDEAVLWDYFNAAPGNVKFIIAPHKIDEKQIEEFIKKIDKKTIRHSNKDEVNLAEYSILIIDCIGLLTKLYQYADIAYVGGAMGETGLHNILEPATFGVPIIIGKNYKKFPEAEKLLERKGLFVIENSEQCSEILRKLASDTTFRQEAGIKAAEFVHENIGATNKILSYIRQEFKE